MRCNGAQSGGHCATCTSTGTPSAAAPKMTGALSSAVVNGRVLPSCRLLLERTTTRADDGGRLTSQSRILFARSGFGVGTATGPGMDEVTEEGVAEYVLVVDLLRECEYEWGEGEWVRVGRGRVGRGRG